MLTMTFALLFGLSGSNCDTKGLISPWTHDGKLMTASDNPDREQYPTLHMGFNEADFGTIGRSHWMGARI